ncbi:hypothetical protein M6B22_13410 [Jatrophihabitans cynanchi]|uniref:Transposase n=1 Tax=Jatrophihabitans cynanchi TaxID=2944128 RepID=A0ABY7JSK5_9ACTN|nr:hypothetical protein [Jatrophihabitans sp. SB3-54]WAX55538.1 hypothetical protein M6B22_13410 [Jatrophihabitans sp. SB3-54]
MSIHPSFTATPTVATPSPVLAKPESTTDRTPIVPDSAREHAPKDARRAGFTANSPATPITADTRPTLQQLTLPGPRRDDEGRGGAMAGLNLMRLIIRCPLLPAWSSRIIRSRKGRPSGLKKPDLFWTFYLLATREFGSHEQLDQELKTHWSAIRDEFWFEHGVLLPDAKADGEVYGYMDFKSWRKHNVIEAGRVEAMLRQLTVVSAPLAAAIRAAEEPTGAVRDPLNPMPWDCLSADGTVMDTASSVYEHSYVDQDGHTVKKIQGSRAKTGKPRLYQPTRNTGHKRSGGGRGLFNVAAVTKGVDTYTRVALGVAIGDHTQGEVPIAMGLLEQIYDVVGNQFPVLLYDGALTPVLWHELTRRYGIYCVNANYARPRQKGEPAFDAPDELLGAPAGAGKRLYGRRRNDPKRTYITGLPPERHTGPDGHTHLHHLVADDGGVYELDRAWRRSDPGVRQQLLVPTRLERLVDDRDEYYFAVTLTGKCTHSSFDVTFHLRDHQPEPGGELSWKSQVANIRILPEALIERYAVVFGRRNQIESFFSWLEQRFRHKDRHASYGIDSERLDLAAVALLENVRAWGHLALRHPRHAEALAAQLAEIAHTTTVAGDSPPTPTPRRSVLDGSPSTPIVRASVPVGVPVTLPRVEVPAGVGAWPAGRRQ